MLQVAAAALVALLVGDTVVTPPPCNSSGVCSTTITAPDVCTNSGSCLSDAGGGGGGGGISNPYAGTFVADAGSFNALCLVDAGCIATWPGQIITGVDGGNLANQGIAYHCETWSTLHSGSGSFSVQIVHPFLTQYCYCGCNADILTGGCTVACKDGGTVTLTENLSGNDQYNYWCCGL